MSESEDYHYSSEEEGYFSQDDDMSVDNPNAAPTARGMSRLLCVAWSLRRADAYIHLR